jgi:hypothetical protein
MKNLKKLLSLGLPFILIILSNPTLVLCQNNCIGPPFSVTMYFTIPAAYCDGPNCVLYTAQENLKKQLLSKSKKKCTDSAAHICVHRTCPQPGECQVVTDVAPYEMYSTCSTDTAGDHWCTIVVGGTYRCICVTNKVRIEASNSSGNYCPADNLTLTAVPDTPITNVDYIQWFVNDAIIDSANTWSQVVTSTGKYEVLVVDTAGLVYLSDPFQVRCPGSIPTMQEWGLIILSVLLLITGIMFIIKKRRVFTSGKK